MFSYKLVFCCCICSFHISHYYRRAKQPAGRSQGGGSSSQVIWPCAPWCSAATACNYLHLLFVV